MMRISFFALCMSALMVVACDGRDVFTMGSPQADASQQAADAGTVPDTGPQFGCTSNLECNDGNAQTSDSCFGGACYHFPDYPAGGCTSNAQCNDGNSTTTDQCVNGSCVNIPTNPVSGCTFDSDCNDGNGSTFDQCLVGICHHTYAGQPGSFGCTSNFECNDGIPSTTDSCVSGACFHFSDPPVNVGCQTDNDCDDSNTQTIDTCVGGVCHHFPDYPVGGGCQSDLDCNDGNDQTNDECIGGICHYTYFETCLGLDDGDHCTDDICVSGFAVHTPVSCQDGYVCDSADGQCVSTCMDLDDEDLCTVDTCVNGSTVHTPVNCNDGVSCTADSCQDGACVHEDACNIGEVCDQGVNQCVDSSTCQGLNDADLCTIDTCVNGSAVHTPIDCNDGAACTVDSCQAGVCVNEDICPTNSTCDLGLGSCVTTCFDLDDNDACTKDSCVNGSAVHTPLSCNDGNSCTIDLCDSIIGCEYSAVPNGTICNDGNACSTDDICQGGACVGPEATVCDDGDPCTNDGCKALSGCFTTPRCEDGFFCNPLTTMCIPTCQSDIECNDDNVCTLDTCEGATSGILGLCSHGFACDPATEICDPTQLEGQQCLPKTPTCTDPLPSFDPGCQDVVCSGGTWGILQIVVCENGVCESGNCVSTGCTSDDQCDDDLFCNGQEICNLDGICTAGVPPYLSDGINCTADQCDEDLNVVIHNEVHNVCLTVGEMCDPSQVPFGVSSSGCFAPTCNPAADWTAAGESAGDCFKHRADAGVPADGFNWLVFHYGFGCLYGVCVPYEDSDGDEVSPEQELDCNDGIDGDLDGNVDAADLAACGPCTVDCTGKTCGDDGCGGTCGSCATGDVCDQGVCDDPNSGNSGCTSDANCLSGQQCLLGQCISPQIEGVRCWDAKEGTPSVPSCHNKIVQGIYHCNSPNIWDAVSSTPQCECWDDTNNGVSIDKGFYPETVLCCVADLGWPPVCKSPTFPLP